MGFSHAPDSSRSPQFVVLADTPINAADAMRALQYLGLDPATTDEDLAAAAIVAKSASGSIILDTVGQLGLTEFSERWTDDLDRLAERTRAAAPADPEEILSSIVGALTCVGCHVTSSHVTAAPLAQCQQDVTRCSAFTIVVFTDASDPNPECAEQWAHAVEDAVQGTVIHLYPGQQ
ncbi:MAG: hypothetical protein Q4G21_05290 [Dermabacter sp.]|nr:hypothetical protein [Dermabacter sp.]